VFVDRAIHKELPVPGPCRADVLDVEPDVRSTVAQELVIPLGSLAERIGALEVIEEKSPGSFRGRRNQVKEIDLFKPVISAQSHNVALVADDLIELELPVVVQRLASSSPSDRLAKALTMLGRVVKTIYILKYFNEEELRHRVQLRLNRSEHRHSLARWIFFANQGEFRTGGYQEIMNKASCLSLVSNAILVWNTLQIARIVETLRQAGTQVPEGRQGATSFFAVAYRTRCGDINRADYPVGSMG
jgi:hypothetical protein